MSVDACLLESSNEEEKYIKQLAELLPLEYERQRKKAAEKLGCREAILDKLVEEKRQKLNPSHDTLQGRGLMFAEVEQWPEPVSGSELLTQLSDTFSRYIALPNGAADVLALWCAHAHAFESFLCSPRLNISSPEKRCGKTTLRDLLALFVPRPLPTENLTLAVLFRTVHLHKPTILADEVDTWLEKKDELQGLLNSGHRKGGMVFRCVGDDYDVRGFEVFATAVLCGIGALPSTLIDRSIVIRLKRAKPGEVQERFQLRPTHFELELCRKLIRFCGDNRQAFEASEPVLPAEAFNRLGDNWRPLFAIAEVAGGNWPQRANNAFASLVTKEADEEGLAIMLLADIRQVLSETDSGRIFSGVLAGALCALSDRPWSEANRGRPISENWLARRLGVFGIKPNGLRIKTDRARGYEAEDFKEAFERYLTTLDDLANRDTVTSQETPGSSEHHNRDNGQACHRSESHETRINAELSRCHVSELDKQTCAICHQPGLRVDERWKGGLRYLETLCTNCGEILDTRVPPSVAIENVSKDLLKW